MLDWDVAGVWWSGREAVACGPLAASRGVWLDRAYTDHFLYGRGLPPAACRAVSPSSGHQAVCPRTAADSLSEATLHGSPPLSSLLPVCCASPLYSACGPPLPLPGPGLGPALLAEGLLLSGGLRPPPFAFPPAQTPPSREGGLAKEHLLRTAASTLLPPPPAAPARAAAPPAAPAARAAPARAAAAARAALSPPAGHEDEGYREVYECRWAQCQSGLGSMEELVRHVNERHVKVERPELEFQCRWQGCPRRGRGFNARYKMLIHIRTHTNEKPHQCLVCGKSFSRLENLKIHNRSHTGEKPYMCPVTGCKKAYSNSSDRFKHVRTHQEQKPYICKMPGCHKRYTDPSSLRKHVRTHGHFYRAAEAPPLSPPSSSPSSSPSPLTSCAPVTSSCASTSGLLPKPCPVLPSRVTSPCRAPFSSPPSPLLQRPETGVVREEGRVLSPLPPHPFLSRSGGGVLFFVPRLELRG